MYEQYCTVIASIIIGISVGFTISNIVTSQLFMFVELPFKA
jgi:hypothetical protein